MSFPVIKSITSALLTAATLSFPVFTFAASNNNGTAPVTGFARSFPLSFAITNAKITVLETGQTYQTDANGNFGPINHPIGKPITLVLEKFGYKTTQSATIIVPPEGLIGPYDNITFQVPELATFYLLIAAVGATIDDNSCHLTATVTGYHKTLNDDRQGEVGAVVTLSPRVDVKPFYFGVFEEGPLKDKTNPFAKGLTAVSGDGGIAFFNLPPSDQPYTLSAVKPGVIFNDAQFLCRKGAFINISPPRGPSVQKQ